MFQKLLAQFVSSKIRILTVAINQEPLTKILN